MIIFSTKPEATAINYKIIHFIMTYEACFCTHCKYLNSLLALFIAFNARLDKFWQPIRRSNIDILRLPGQIIFWCTNI